MSYVLRIINLSNRDIGSITYIKRNKYLQGIQALYIFFLSCYQWPFFFFVTSLLFYLPAGVIIFFFFSFRFSSGGWISSSGPGDMDVNRSNLSRVLGTRTKQFQLRPLHLASCWTRHARGSFPWMLRSLP